MTDAIDRLSRTVTVVGAIIAATVSTTSLLTNCSKQRSDRYATFRSAVGTEDARWKALYDDYLTTFGPDFSANQERRRAKLIALFTIAQGRLPTFAEFSVDADEKKQAIDRLGAMQTSLLNAIESQGGADPALKSELALRSFAGKLQIGARAAAPQSSASAPADLPPDEPVSRETVALTGPSPTGWDVDLFWCDGKAAAANYRLARSVADSLAQRAESGRSIAPGMLLGSIRVRVAPAALQQGQGPARYTWLVADAGPGEKEAAIELQRAINNGLGRELFGLGTSTGRPTRWYLSAFVCPGDGAASPPVPQAPAGAADAGAEASALTTMAR